jgi:biotin operon repressor
MPIPSSRQRVRGVPAPRQLPVEADWGLAYEVLIALGLFLGDEIPSSYEVGEAWIKSMRRKASPELRDNARWLIGREGYAFVGLAGLARESGGKSVASLVARLRRDNTGEAKRSVLHAEPQVSEALLRGDADARREFLKRVHKGSREAAERALDADPQALADDVADVIERFDREIFSQVGPPLEAELKASAQAAARLSKQMPADRLIVRVTRGVEYRPEPWIKSILLIPTVLNRPWVDISEHEGSKYFYFPASAEVAPDAELVQVYKALGDETRLRILRQLSNGESSLSDIAEQLSLAKSTIHQHMVVLRQAGLTRSVVGAGAKGYVLNDRPDLNSLLDAYLKA